MNDIIALPNLKVYLGIDAADTKHDTILATLISYNSELIQNELAQNLIEATYTDLALDGNGRSILYLPYWPVMTIIQSEFIISAANNKINFDEGGAELTATIASATYTGATLATAIAAAMNAVIGKTLIYTCTFSTITRKFTIGASAIFTIRWNTGTNKTTDISTLCGYSDAINDIGAASYISDNPVGSAYLTTVEEDDTELTEGEDEDFRLYANDGVLIKNASIWAKGLKNIILTMTAGYKITDIPKELQFMAMMKIAREWKKQRGASWGEDSRTLSDGSVQTTRYDDYLVDGELKILNKYKRKYI